MTKEQVVKHELANLIGSELLRAYMHGFFVHHRLHRRVTVDAHQFVHED